MLKILSFLLLFSVVAYGQTESKILQGKTLQYTIYTGGSEVPLTMVLDSVTPAFVKIGWTIEGMGTGKWVMTKNSLDNASRGYWDEPGKFSKKKGVIISVKSSPSSSPDNCLSLSFIDAKYFVICYQASKFQLNFICYLRKKSVNGRKAVTPNHQ